MNNFFTLTKVFFLSGFNVNKKKKNQKNAFKLFLLTLALFMLISISLSFVFSEQMKEAGLPIETFLGVILMFAFMLNLVISIFQLQSIIFNTKDYEFLESLPLSKPTIIASKLFATYLINLSEDIALILPAILIYFINGGSPLNAVMSFVGAIFISFVPILISAIIGSLSALISSKSKHSNLINIITSLIFITVLFGGYMYIIYAGADKLNTVMESVIFLSWLSHSISGVYIEILYYVLFNLAAVAIVIVLISLIYRPVNTWLKSNNGHIDYDKLKNKNKDSNLKLDHLLLKKEWNMLSRRPQYILNSILGEIFFLIMAMVFILMPNLFVGGEEIPESLPYVFVCLVPAMGILMNSIATPTSSSISFEGKYGYEMLRCYPIDSSAIIKAKLKIGIYLQAIMNVSVSMIITIALILKGYYLPYYIIPVFLYPQFAGILLSIVGMLTGLRWPKLDYENESQVLKNSAASNLLILFVMLPSLIVFGIHLTSSIFGLEYEFIHYVSLGFITILYLVAILASALLLKKKGTSLFDRIIKNY